MSESDVEVILLRRTAVERMCSLSRSAIYAAMKADSFPRPIRVGGGSRGSVRWRRADVLAWIAERQPTGAD